MEGLQAPLLGRSKTNMERSTFEYRAICPLAAKRNLSIGKILDYQFLTNKITRELRFEMALELPPLFVNELLLDSSKARLTD